MCVCIRLFLLLLCIKLNEVVKSLLLLCREDLLLPEGYDLTSIKNCELVCRTECKLAGSSVLMIHFECREVGK